MKSKLPVELEIENRKIIKSEIELQEVLNNIEHTVDNKQAFEDDVVTARTTILSIKKTFNNFQESCKEWDDVDVEIFTEIQNLNTTHERTIRSLQTSFQKACLEGQRRLAKLESDELLNEKHLSPEQKVRQRKMQKAEIANKSAAITENLVNVARMMNTHVKQGEESNVLLENSSQQIKETHEEFKGLTGYISVARKLLNKYNRRELTDTLLIFFGLVIFFATVLYIISKRL